MLQILDGVFLCDGWHRLAAAIFRGDEFLYVDLVGDIREALKYGIPFDSGEHR